MTASVMQRGLQVAVSVIRRSVLFNAADDGIIDV